MFYRYSDVFLLVLRRDRLKRNGVFDGCFSGRPWIGIIILNNKPLDESITAIVIGDLSVTLERN